MTTNDLPITDEQKALIGFAQALNMSESEMLGALDVLTTGDGDQMQALQEVDGAAADLATMAYELLEIAKALRDERDHAIRERVELEEAVKNPYSSENRSVRDLVEYIQSATMESQGEMDFYMVIETLQELLGFSYEDASSLAYFLNSGIEGILLDPGELKHFLPAFEKLVANMLVIEASENASSLKSEEE